MRDRLPSLKEALKPKEIEIERSIRKYLDMRKIFNFPSHAGVIIPIANGVPDIIAILPGIGRFLGIEVKHPGWKFNPKRKHEREQWQFLDNIRRSDGVAFFATSIDDVIRGLQYKTELPPIPDFAILPSRRR
jgi:hypothetical protein